MSESKVTSEKEVEQARAFRKGWSHKPTPIPPESQTAELWYSETCADQMLVDYASSREAANEKLIAELVDTLEMVLASAFPNKREHPTMYKAWGIGKDVLLLARARGGQKK